ASSKNVKNRERAEAPASARSLQEFPIEPEAEREIVNNIISEHDLNTKLRWAVQEYLFAHKYALNPRNFGDSFRPSSAGSTSCMPKFRMPTPHLRLRSIAQPARPTNPLRLRRTPKLPRSKSKWI